MTCICNSYAEPVSESAPNCEIHGIKATRERRISELEVDLIASSKERHELATKLRKLEAEVERLKVSSQNYRDSWIKEQDNSSALREDRERLDWLEQRRLALNKHYGTAYGWEFVSSHNVNRLFVAGTCTIDLNDAKANAGDIRAAIDAAKAKEIGGV